MNPYHEPWTEYAVCREIPVTSSFPSRPDWHER